LLHRNDQTAAVFNPLNSNCKKCGDGGTAEKVQQKVAGNTGSGFRAAASKEEEG